LLIIIFLSLLQNYQA